MATVRRCKLVGTGNVSYTQLLAINLGDCEGSSWDSQKPLCEPLSTRGPLRRRCCTPLCPEPYLNFLHNRPCAWDRLLRRFSCALGSQHVSAEMIAKFVRAINNGEEVAKLVEYADVDGFACEGRVEVISFDLRGCRTRVERSSKEVGIVNVEMKPRSHDILRYSASMDVISQERLHRQSHQCQTILHQRCTSF